MLKKKLCKEQEINKTSIITPLFFCVRNPKIGAIAS